MPIWTNPRNRKALILSAISLIKQKNNAPTAGALMLTERMILYMTEKQFMSGSELRQYLHISTRKMKYLMDNNYIPHENTGHTTHKYRVRTEDAVRFKTRMDTEPGFLSELSGMFSNRTEWHPLPMFEATPENCEAFRRWLNLQWAELPALLLSEKEESTFFRKGTCRSQSATHPRVDTGRNLNRHQARHYTVLRQSGIYRLYGITAKAGAPAHGKI